MLKMSPFNTFQVSERKKNKENEISATFKHMYTTYTHEFIKLGVNYK